MWQLLLRLFGGGKSKQQEPVDTRTLGEMGIVKANNITVNGSEGSGLSIGHGSVTIGKLKIKAAGELDFWMEGDVVFVKANNPIIENPDNVKVQIISPPPKEIQHLSPRSMSRQSVRPPKKFDPTTTERAIKRFDAINRSRPDSPRLYPYPANTGNANRHAVIDDSIYYTPSRPITGYNADTEPQRYSCVNPSPAPAVPYNPPCPAPSYNNPSPSYYSDPSPSWDSGGSSGGSDGGGCD